MNLLVHFLNKFYGLTIVAFGNGAPDIFSAIAAFTNSNPSTAGVAIGALLGKSAVACICDHMFSVSVVH